MQDVKLVCAWCKRHLNGHTEAERVSHGICVNCANSLLGKSGLECEVPEEDDPWVDLGGGG